MFSSEPAPQQTPSVGTPMVSPPDPEQFANTPDPGIPYYPQGRYIEKNWKPEQMPESDLKNLANAHRQAVSTGVLSPELGEHLLPMALAEGRPNNFGVRHIGLYANPKNLKRFSDMGLAVSNPNKEDVTKYPKDNYPRIEVGKDNIMDFSGEEIRSGEMAKIMAAILSAKSEKSGGNPEASVKSYNGKGKAVEHWTDGFGTDVLQNADVNHYWMKVQAAKALLDHPKNKQLKETYQRHYNGTGTTPR